MELHSNEKIIWQGRASWKALYTFWLKWVILSLVPIIGAVLLMSFTDTDVPWQIISLISLFGLVVTFLAVLFKRAFSVYTITTHRINITRGILGKKRQNGRLDRIQNANCNQSLIERMLDTGTIELETAGDDEGNFFFYSVAKPNYLISVVESGMEDRSQDSWQKQREI